jgi:hypothetical protein
MKLHLTICLALASLSIATSASAIDGKPGKALAKPSAKTTGNKLTPQQMALQKFDTNVNGKLDPEEQVAARKAASEARKNKNKKGQQPSQQPQNGNAANAGNGINGLNGMPLGGGGGNGANSQGGGWAKMLERFDLNRDGQLNEQEMMRAKQMMGGKLPAGFLPPNVGGKRPAGKFRQ